MQNAIILENVALRTEETSLRVDGTIGNIEDGARTIDSRPRPTSSTSRRSRTCRSGAARLRLQPAFELTASGPLDRLSVNLNAREASVGRVAGDLTVDAAGPDRQRIAGTVSMAHLNVAPLVRRADMKSDMSGEPASTWRCRRPAGRIRGTYTIKADRVQIMGYDARNVDASGRIDGRVVRVNGSADAYGGRATTEGVVVAGAAGQSRSGRAARHNVDLRNLPPSAERAECAERPAVRLHADGAQMAGIPATCTMDASTLAGASIAPGTTGQFSFGAGAAPTYAAQGQVSNLDVEQIGRGFAIRALASDRYRSRITATYTMKGSGGGRYPLTIDATGTAVDSEMFGAELPADGFHDEHQRRRSPCQGGRAVRTGWTRRSVTGNERVAGKLTGAVDVDTTFRDFTGRASLSILSMRTGRSISAARRLRILRLTRAIIDGTVCEPRRSSDAGRRLPGRI